MYFGESGPVQIPYLDSIFSRAYIVSQMKGDPNFMEKGRRPQFFDKMEDNLNFDVNGR